MSVGTVKIRGKEYKINPFSDCHISTLSNLLKDTSNLQYQFDAGFVLKEIILPDLPYEIIRESRNGKHVFMIHAREISSLVTDILRFYYTKEIERLTQEGDFDLAEQFKANLVELNIEQSEENSEDKDRKIAELEKNLATNLESGKDAKIAELEAKLKALETT
jgi:hypothetical protein